ncbi:diaminopimelate epimerase [Clostridium sp. MT-14]|uniref:Diaminopimelate epimerase n=1 Tax=Clostridium aromativorans TaxID=2836848 RepID=A0ABS8N2L1_9CLOT|nr:MULTISPECIES: diaminopimelate epimerase [Clostridium]KAA8676158.1 diaminopimelate epimerase [Clostridium sp. HV4-5-A1G]MCC9294032.1 diaminopimelate epimerase [Clostridium aromativorans]CAB1242338.1 Diaminopimelate epimerase [Clostridiaceae bacterium BL-3]
MKFTKMQGSGNDFIVIDDRKNKFLGKESKLGVKLCNRHFGIGADGVLIVRGSKIAQIKMIIINSDGSYASMCGNGIRCFAKYVWENNIVKGSSIRIETGDGIKEAFLNIDADEVKEVTVDMGTPSFVPGEIPADFEDEIVNKEIEANGKIYKITSLFMGVPHTVIFGRLEKYQVREGKSVEKYAAFPQGTNVNFCEIIDKNNIKVKTWERGAGPTLACGTGSCACVVAANKLNFTDKKVKVTVPGGNILVEIRGNNVFMTGPAEVSFKGEYDM